MTGTTSCCRRLRWYESRKPCPKSSHATAECHWQETSTICSGSQLRAPSTYPLWVLKVYRDVVVDGRGTKPVEPQEILKPRDEREFRREDIGYLWPVRLAEW